MLEQSTMTKRWKKTTMTTKEASRVATARDGRTSGVEDSMSIEVRRVASVEIVRN